MKKVIRNVMLVVLAVIIVVLGVFAGIYYTRLRTMFSIAQITSYEDSYDLYTMNVEYDYDLDAVIDYGISDDQTMSDAILQEALPMLPVTIRVPEYGCTAFTLQDADHVYMGRNYDLKNSSSAMLVYCAPHDGYRSVATAAMDNVSANKPNAGIRERLASLTAPFICIDGMNEKGVSITVHALDSEPTYQNTGKPKIATSLAIRLVLDRAATTQEAVDLLRQYDMYACFGGDYHFYITDATGDGRVVEYDPESETRELVDISSEAVTNFYILYKDRVLQDQNNGIYGHGKKRYDTVLEIMDEQRGSYSVETVWDALEATAQYPDPEAVKSNTQWSISYNNTDLTAEIVMRRNWSDRFCYDLSAEDLPVIRE